jgi:DNA-binding NarL/FixJ family response regulator
VPVLAAVEDFLFRSKIRATAKQLGVDITFAQIPGEILSKARELNPSLIILDLNGIKTTPIQTIAALKADPTTASIRVLGFISHIDTAGIDAARRAGADEVLARGGFAANLAEILATAK